MKIPYLPMLALVLGMMANTAQAAMIVHAETPGSRTSRVAFSAPVGLLTVDAEESISSFGVDIDLNGRSNVTFLIFDTSSKAVLYSSAPKSFDDVGAGYKFSDQFFFTFRTGTIYGLTAVSDRGGSYFVDTVANNIGNYHFLKGNMNTTGTTLQTAKACCDVGTALISAPPPAPVPEPGSLTLAGLGLACVVLVGRRKARRTTTV